MNSFIDDRVFPKLGTLLCAPLRALWAVAAALTLTACGGGGSSSVTLPSGSLTPVTPSSVAAQAVLGVGGGSVPLNLENGTSLTLAIPAGALPGNQTIALQSQATVAGQRFNVKLSPAGLLLQNGLQATLTVTLAPGAAAPAAMFFDGVAVPFTVVSATSPVVVQVRIGSFGGSVPASVVARAWASLLSWVPAARAQASAPACSGIPQAGDGGNGSLTDAEVVDADVYGQCMVAEVNRLIVNGSYEQAFRTANSVGAYLERVGVQGGGLGSDGHHVQLASQAACLALRDKVEAARQTAVTSTNTLYPAIKPVLYWQAIVEKLGAQPCPNVGPTEYQDVVQDKIAESLIHYQTLRTTVDLTSSPAYAAARQEGQDGQRTAHEVRSLQPPAAVQALVQAQIEQRAQPALLENILHAPFQACRDNGDHSGLIELMQTFGNPTAVQRAAQHCGTTLNAESRDNNDAVLSAMSPSLGGGLNGNAVTIQTQGNLFDVAKDGKLVLDGPIRALQCPVGSPGGTESLIVKLNGVVVATQASAPHLHAPLQISMAQALNAAGINPDTFSTATLTLERTGSPCGGYWGVGPVVLATITLNVINDILRFQSDSDQVYAAAYPTLDSCGQGVLATRSLMFREIRVGYPRPGKPPYVSLLNTQVAQGVFEASSQAEEVLGGSSFDNPRSFVPSLPVFTLESLTPATFVPASPGSRDGVFETSFVVVEQDIGFFAQHKRWLKVVVTGNTATFYSWIGDVDSRPSGCWLAGNQHLFSPLILNVGVGIRAP
jgi:hypothetical protein